MLYSDMTLIVLVGSVIVPLLVGLLTKLNASSGIKAVLNFGLNGVVAALATVNQIDFDLKVFLINWGVGWAVATATYYGLYKPTTVAEKVAEIAPNVGIG